MTETPAEPGKRGKGRRKSGGGAESAKGDSQRALTPSAIKKRGDALAQLEDKKKAARGRRRLLHNLLTGIADGGIGQPSKAAEAYLALLPKKGAEKAGVETEEE